MKRQHLLPSILAAVLVATLAACGGGDGGDGHVVRACDFAADGFCDVVTGPAAVLDASGYTQAGCTSGGGTYGTTCPTANRVGRCSDSVTSGGVTATITESYYSPTWDATTAAADCASAGGTFTAG